jgi:hypothetical protein
MDSFKSKTFLLFVAFMVIITTFLPLFTAHSRFNIGVNKYWAFIWFISALCFAPRTYANKNFIYTFLFLIILVFFLFNTRWGNVDAWNKRESRLEILSFLVPISLYTYFRSSKDFYGLAILVKWALFFIAITAILTIYSASVDPLYVRNLTGGVYTVDEAAKIQNFGGGAYGFAGALIFLFPMIIYYYRNSSKIPFSKPQILIFGILCLIAVIRMQIFANILISFLAIILSLGGSKRIRKSLLYVGLFLTLTVILPKQLYIDFLDKVSLYFNPESDVFYKLTDMGRYLGSGNSGIETSAADRISRYPMLWEGFKGNPLLGFFNSGSSMDISLGGHLYWMNKLAVYGLVIFIPFVLIFYFHIKLVLKNIDTEFAFYFLISVLAGLGLGLMKSLFGHEYWYMFFFIIPSMYYLPLLKKKKPDLSKQPG